jgi:hypothetical protein
VSGLVDARRFWRLAKAMEMEADPFRNKYQLDPAFHRLVVIHLILEERLEATQEAARRVVAVLDGKEMAEAEYELRAVLTEGSPDPAGVVELMKDWQPSEAMVEDLNRDA